MSQPGANGAGTAFPERVAIAGSGTIACGLAACVAAAGGTVTLWARSDDSAARVRSALADAGVTVTSDLAALADATLVVEAVVEQADVKRELLGSLQPLLTDAAALATTTSSLSVRALAEATADPARFFGLHVFNPVQKMDLVELCFPPAAGDELRARANAFCEALGKVGVEVPDEPGFVVNRLLFPYLFDAVRLLERTGMQPEQVDACMQLGASHPMGPLRLLDLVGLDVADAIGEALYGNTEDPSHRPPGRIKQLMGEGRLGRKSGSGFYRY